MDGRAGQAVEAELIGETQVSELRAKLLAEVRAPGTPSTGALPQG